MLLKEGVSQRERMMMEVVSSAFSYSTSFTNTNLTLVFKGGKKVPPCLEYGTASAIDV